MGYQNLPIKYGIPVDGRGRLHPARHRIVNLGSVWYRGTIEFRMFNGTLNYNKIISYINDTKNMCSGDNVR